MKALSTASLDRFLAQQKSNRKLRLFACACALRVWHLINKEELKDCLQRSERFAEGGLHDDFRIETFNLGLLNSKSRAGLAVVSTAWETALGAAEHTASNAAQAAPRRAGRKAQTELINCIFGLQKSRKDPLDPRWLTSTVVDLAQAIYEEHAFGRMPILSDALMDAGCDNEEIILHCRSGGPHVRGCWVVDLLTGKE